jgi:hypothetical protein
MNEPTQLDSSREPVNSGDGERTKQVTVAGWTAGISAVAALGTLEMQPTWPVAFGVASIAAMVAVACYCILKR